MNNVDHEILVVFLKLVHVNHLLLEPLQHAHHLRDSVKDGEGLLTFWVN